VELDGDGDGVEIDTDLPSGSRCEFGVDMIQRQRAPFPNQSKAWTTRPIGCWWTSELLN
jgi:hypothetical protein